MERENSFPLPPQFNKNVKIRSIKQFLNYNRNNFVINTHKDSHYTENKSNWIKSIIPEYIKTNFRFLRDLYKVNIEALDSQIMWLYDKLRFMFFCISYHCYFRYEIIISIDNIGLVTSKFLNFLKKSEIYYWSLEIDTNKSNLFVYRLFEVLYTSCLSSTREIIIQENSRLKVLSNHYSVDFNGRNIYFIPHSPINSKKFLNRNFFKQKFKFRENKKIILHAGWIHDAMCVDQLALVSRYWKNKYQLVLHEREKRSAEEPFIKHIHSLSGKRLKLSLDPVSFDNIDDVFSSADIGIIAYDKRYGGGRENVFKASGKLGQYLKCGVPVIALNLPGYSELFSKYNCGLVFNHFGEIENCIDQIFSNYQFYRDGCFKCFEEEFDFSKYFNRLLLSISNHYKTN
ncbi:MAG: hypothetical protein CMI23_05595 [Opitutae bacterium]|nr:hypothetical protein [Opitutae bacterium]